MDINDRFDGLAFPVIRVRVGNHKGIATMKRNDGNIIAATVDYSYDMPDGERFAILAARAVWAKHAELMDKDGYGPDVIDVDPVFIPGDMPKGWVFTVIPGRYFRN